MDVILQPFVQCAQAQDTIVYCRLSTCNFCNDLNTVYTHATCNSVRNVALWRGAAGANVAHAEPRGLEVPLRGSRRARYRRSKCIVCYVAFDDCQSRKCAKALLPE